MSDFTFDNDDFGFELNDANRPELSEYSAIPAGVYDAQIEQVEMKPTQAGGKQLSIRFTLLGPTQEGRKAFENVILHHIGDKAEIVEKINMEKLERIRSACGIANLTKASQLTGCRLSITMKARRDDQSRTEPDFSKYAPISGPPVLKAPVVSSAASAPSTGARPAWAK